LRAHVAAAKEFLANLFKFDANSSRIHRLLVRKAFVYETR
jgi:hypothetical protein